ncbi:MAG TPA: carboxy terminal-processing peptidase [Ferruginibacter sp.]|nr:carboxy terminal-processing peptidase [Ferruginibacter sp.]HRO17966.1 carboxy terminal-processing peptidase [Ferruginibacter sp.]HRQ20950.1 carboxy terminal-processing peptidase [Ferruginibacter sp.]
MQKIADFIMNRKILPFFIALTLFGTFIVLQSKGNADKEDPIKQKHARILRNVGILLKEGHFSPLPINDAFSISVLKKFTEELDTDKNMFFQSDIDQFQKYATVIDDEILGKPIESFYEITDVYKKRMDEVLEIYTKILNQPFDFTTHEKVDMDPKKNNYPKTEAERTDNWRKRLKYLTLAKFVELQDEREKNKGKEGFVVKPDSTLEREARQAIHKQLDRFFNTKKNRETTDELFSSFVNSIAGLMDPHTNYYPPVDLRSFNEGMSGRFYGIGAQLKEDDGKIKIASLVTAGPAWKNGELKENDEILKVGQGDAEPVDVTGFAVSDAVKLIRGSQKGSEVRLTVRKPDGTIQVVKIIRDEVKLEDTFVKSAIIEGENRIGYIYLPEFYADFERPDGARCAVDVARELEKLKAENVEGIIMDLRGNGGGSLYDVVQMVGLFIPDGPVVQVKGRDEKSSILRDRDRNVQYSGPLAVLVDETSASASEIFAAAIQDYKRGVVIGSTSTFGKGTVQRNIPLSPQRNNTLFGSTENEDLGSLKLTLQKFYRINGGATQLKGVEPDIILPDRLEYLKFREKDITQSLKWDEIEQLSYAPWTSDFSIEPIAKNFNSTVSAHPVFSKIKENVQWLEKNNNRSYSLNINQYKQDQKTLKNVYKNLDSLYKLQTPLVVKNLKSDVETIEAAIDKKEKNDIWLKRVMEDIFIDQSVKVVNTMIDQINTARIERVERK